MRTEKEEKANRMDELIDSIKLRSPQPSEEHSAEKSFSRLIARIQIDNKSIAIFNRRINHYRIWLAAATVALLIAMSGWLFMMLENDPSFMVASNSSGIVQNISLPDGTSIKLNNHSKLIYPQSFTGDQREVFLEGEAYFDVTPNKNHPFIVRAGELKIQVLGTRFTVNANSQNSKITATLLEGSINVSDERKQLLMKPNQQLTYEVNSGKMYVTSISTNSAKRDVRWTQNVWILSDTPLLDICQRLENLFNVKIIIMNEQLIDKSFTGEFYTNESLESILKIMQTSTSFTYEKKGENIILK